MASVSGLSTQLTNVCSVSALFTINVEKIVVIIINNNEISLFDVEKYKWPYK